MTGLVGEQEELVLLDLNKKKSPNPETGNQPVTQLLVCAVVIDAKELFPRHPREFSWVNSELVSSVAQAG